MIGVVCVAVAAVGTLVVGLVAFPDQTNHFLNTGNFDYVPAEQTPAVQAVAGSSVVGEFSLHLTQLLQAAEKIE